MYVRAKGDIIYIHGYVCYLDFSNNEVAGLFSGLISVESLVEVTSSVLTTVLNQDLRSSGMIILYMHMHMHIDINNKMIILYILQLYILVDRQGERDEVKT